jgi:hypothetical protein
MAISGLDSRIGNGICNREVINDLSLHGREFEISVYLFVVELANRYGGT